MSNWQLIYDDCLIRTVSLNCSKQLRIVYSRNQKEILGAGVFSCTFGLLTHKECSYRFVRLNRDPMLVPLHVRGP